MFSFMLTDTDSTLKACKHCNKILLIPAMAERESVTETLKAENQMEWVRRMNSIHNRATKFAVITVFLTTAYAIFATNEPQLCCIWQGENLTLYNIHLHTAA